MFRQLVRKNKTLSREECIDILKQEKRGILSVNGENSYPYGMPMNHWYDENSDKIYFHCGNSGYRLDCLKNDNKVSFCVYDKGHAKKDEWALNFKSVIVFGKINIINDIDKVIDITTKLSHKFTNDEEYILKEISNHAHRTILLELTIEHICGKTVIEA